MLKILSTSVKPLETYSSHTKCAEIHYQSINYQIVCVVCNEIYQHLNEFVQHFQDEHFYEFLGNLQNLYPTNDVLINKQEKCVKQEITELLENDEHCQVSVEVKESNDVLRTVYEEVNTCGEILDFKEEGKVSQKY